ncbi:muscarinic acetylcholine receptor M3-like [Anneissia japonica]|uniref:muscarinic acetylcholine receptor M3-like n=1 Tax=Anneissia japonica TaxID=1529436 RepID=UPI0014254FDC|nr:muscarinic acetylcholine receptor M3-like [Anneissia japonica]
MEANLSFVYKDSDSSLNYSDDDYISESDIYPPSLTNEHSLIRIICFLSIAIISTSANGLVLLVYALNRKLRTYENAYIINLAISDLLVSLLVMPINIIFFRHSWNQSYELCKIKVGLEHSLLQVSVFTVVAMANDRHKAITNPIQYRVHREIMRVAKICISTWILAFVIWIPLQTVWGLLDHESRFIKSYCYGLQYVNVYNNTINVLLYFWMPMILISVSTYRVYKAIKSRPGRQKLMCSPSITTKKMKVISDTEMKIISRSSSTLEIEIEDDTQQKHCDMKTREGNVNPTFIDEIEVDVDIDSRVSSVVTVSERLAKRREAGLSSSKISERRGIRVLKCIVIVYFITWFPYGARLTLFTVLFHTGHDELNYSIPVTYLKWMAFCNSLLNPITYFISNKSLRTAAKEIFTPRYFKKLDRA